jgi:hypothetical protein
VTWRLETVAVGLVEQLEVQPEPHLRAIAERVAVAALRAMRVSDGRIDHALAALRAGDYGDVHQRATVRALANELDEAAWDLQERLDAGEADHEDHSAAFRRTRAVMSLWFALDSDATVAAIEASYEARAATGDAAVRREIAAAS